MTIRFAPQRTSAKFTEDVLIIPLFQGEKELPVVIAKSTRVLIDDVRASKEFTGAHQETHLIPVASGSRIQRVCLLGLGERVDLTLEEYRRAIGAAVMRVRKTQVKTCGIVIRENIIKGAAVEDVVRASALGVLLAGYHFVHARKEKKNDTSILRTVTFLGTRATKREVNQAIREAAMLTSGITFVKDMGNTPPNVLTPAALATKTLEAAKGIAGLSLQVLDKKQIEKEKLGGILGVAQGSQHEPRLIVLEYKPVAPPFDSAQGRLARGRPIALVGKAITFDSGGISIKPALKMDEMKFDMAGGAAVIGILLAAARLKLPVHLVGIVCAAENMPSHTSYKPGDILTLGDETTVEVLNTDAEGRIVVADGVIYARKYKPETIVTIATLTGAILVALADYATGLFTDDTELARTFTEAGEKSGELVWRMPMPKKWGELLKSPVADLRNVPANRIADASLGALFIRAFAEKGTRFAHLDIGNTAWQTNPQAYEEPGATGVSVRLLTEFLRLLY